NINANNVWSATFEPYNTEPEDYRVVFSPDKAEFIRKDGSIETHTQVVVSPEDNAEIRKLTLTNNGEHSRTLELTSYLEVVLAHPDADIAHPAFNNLFVTTEYIPEYHSLIAVRRPRSAHQKPIWALHTLTVEGEVVGDLQYETDRSKFIGRNRDLSHPLAMDVDQPLSNTVGAVLDPIMSLRQRVKIRPGQSCRIAYTLAVAESREDALVLADKYRDGRVVERAFEFAWNRSQIETAYLAINSRDMEICLQIIPHILFCRTDQTSVGEQYQGKQQGSAWPVALWHIR
ncbi:MAG TPA: cyclic beta 1-2 glucan synthetase, partial [Bacillota bacterium]|nr:cyclic beta 1-2 glucan synthetase [Bacillota bacterium]